MRFDTINQFDYTSLSYLRKQAPNRLARCFLLIFRHIVQHLWTNPTRLPEFDEKLVEVHTICIPVPNAKAEGTY